MISVQERCNVFWTNRWFESCLYKWLRKYKSFILHSMSLQIKCCILPALPCCEVYLVHFPNVPPCLWVQNSSDGAIWNTGWFVPEMTWVWCNCNVAHFAGTPERSSWQTCEQSPWNVPLTHGNIPANKWYYYCHVRPSITSQNYSIYNKQAKGTQHISRTKEFTYEK